MVFRFIALCLLLLGLALGLSLVLAIGANTFTKQALALGVPTLASLPLALAWWRKAERASWSS